MCLWPNQLSNRACVASGSRLPVRFGYGIRIVSLVLKLLIAAVIMLCVSPAHATLACGMQNGNKNLNAGYLSVPRNASSGQSIATMPPDSFLMTCQFTSTAPVVTTATHMPHFDVAVAPVAGMVDVYPTGVAGIGVRYTISAVGCNEQSLTITNKTAMFHCVKSGPVGSDQSVPASIVAEFVKIGPVAAGALTLTSVPQITIGYKNDFQVTDWGQGYLYNGTASGTIRQQSCSVQNSAQAITLPTVTTRSLDSGAGTVAGSQPFSVDLSCAAGAQVSITLTDATNPSNTSSVLSLASGSTATGVGIELRRANDMKISYGPDSAAPGTTNQWLVGAAPNGALGIPLSARYVRTTGTLAAGSVKALATFTMSYN
jgi:type 1 fimbria pilin